MAGGGIRILSHNQHPHIGERCDKSTEHSLTNRQVAAIGRGLGSQEVAEGGDLGGYRFEGGRPCRVDQSGERPGHQAAASSGVTGGSADHGKSIQRSVMRQE